MGTETADDAIQATFACACITVQHELLNIATAPLAPGFLVPTLDGEML